MLLIAFLADNNCDFPPSNGKQFPGSEALTASLLFYSRLSAPLSLLRFRARQFKDRFRAERLLVFAPRLNRNALL